LSFWRRGPDDGTVVPWESSVWGFWDKDENLVPMKNQDIYVKDLFGLKTVDQSGKLFLQPIPGIPHSQWLRDKENFIKNVLPHLS